MRERETCKKRNTEESTHMELQVDEEKAGRSQEEKKGKKSTSKMTRKSIQGDPEVVLSLLSIIQVEPRQQYDLT
jgi:hypothetical protein